MNKAPPPLYSGSRSLFRSPSQSNVQHEIISSDNQKHSGVEIILNRRDRTYQPNDIVEGVVLISAKDGWPHDEINVHVTGEVRLETPPSTKNDIIIPSPIPLIKTVILVKSSGSIPKGIHSFPFSFSLVGPWGEHLHESQRGYIIDIDYVIKVSIERGVFRRTLEDKWEYLIRSRPGMRRPRPMTFHLTPGEKSRIVDFVITGRWYETVCSLARPFRGYIMVEKCNVPIRSILLRLCRVEKVSHKGVGDMIRKYFSAFYGDPDLAEIPAMTTTMDSSSDEVIETSEIQCLQIADGNVSRNVPIDVLMMFPILSCAPTIKSAAFSINYEIELVVLLQDENVASRTFPLILYRDV